MCIICTSCTLYTKEKVGEAQTKIHFKNNSIEVDNPLLFWTEEFLKEASNHVDVDSISKNYVGIYVGTPSLGDLGTTYFREDGSIYSVISPINNTNNRLRIIVYHELAHAYLGSPGHCHELCGEIMSAGIGNTVWYRDWEAQKEVLFNKTKHESVYFPIKETFK